DLLITIGDIDGPILHRKRALPHKHQERSTPSAARERLPGVGGHHPALRRHDILKGLRIRGRSATRRDRSVPELATQHTDQNRSNVTLWYGSSLVTPEYQ